MEKKNLEIFVWYECDYSGGPDWSLIDLVKNWPNKDQKFKVFVNKNHEGVGLLESKSNKNFKIIVIPSYFYYSYWSQKFKNYKNRYLLIFFKFIATIFSFLSILILSFIFFAKNKSKAVLFSSGGFPGGLSHFPAMLSAFLLCKKKRWMIVRSHVNKVFFLKFFNFISKLSLHGIISISKVIKSELIKNRCFDKKKIKVIYPGIDHKKNQNLNVKKIFNKSNLVVGIIGHLSKRKGHEILFKAINILYKKNKKVRIIVIGSDINEPGENFSRKYYLKKLANRLGISKIIYWQNYTSEIFAYFKNIDILVLPSIKDESFGRVLVEGMASDTVVVGSKTGGIPEIISHNNNGLLFEMGSYEDLSKNIRLLIQDRILRKKLVKNGKKYFLKHFSSEIYANSYFRLFR